MTTGKSSVIPTREVFVQVGEEIKLITWEVGT